MMPPPVQIRDCQYTSDLAAIGDIVNHEIQSSTAIYEEQPKSHQEIDTWFIAKKAGQWPVRGAYDECGKLLGFATFGPFRPQAAYRFTAEHSIYVSREVRGQGVGTLLLSDIIEQAEHARLHLLIGCIDADNYPSLALHQKLGFVHCGTVRQAGFKFDRWLDVSFLQKPLQAHS